jgi:phosphoribosylformylglycinamidine synthase
MKFAVLVFPGSNCDHDCEWALKNVLRQKVEMVWHQDSELPKGVDCVVVPGGFSYGDYLRCGAIARFSPIMKAVQAFAKKGGMVFGICNGFQILTEAGLLPGALIRNKSLHFICKDIFLKAERTDTLFSSRLGQAGERPLRLPIAHGEGNYFCDDATLASLKEHRQILFRYCDENGRVSPRSNPNGSLENIAGIINKEGRILGMMPHPERACEASLGNTDGRLIFESCLSALSRV